MKLAIVGTRELSGLPVVVKAVKAFLVRYSDIVVNDEFQGDPHGITEIVSGGARGVDRLAELFASDIGVGPAKVFEPKIGQGRYSRENVKMAMGARNQEIVNYADAMVAIRLPDQSPGTDDAIERMKAAGKPVAVFDLRPVFVELVHGNAKPASR